MPTPRVHVVRVILGRAVLCEARAAISDPRDVDEVLAVAREVAVAHARHGRLPGGAVIEVWTVGRRGRRVAEVGT